MTPSLSIVIPTFNRGRTLVKVLGALKSRQEELRDVEVIIVDDGSTDETDRLVTPYLNSGALDCQYLSGPNGGPSVARNRGIRAARSGIVLLLDCDIIPSEDLVREHRLFHERFTGSEYALRGSVKAVNAPEESVRRVEFHTQAPDGNLTPVPWHAFRSGNISLKRDWLLEQGLFDPDLRTQEDTELGYRLGKRGLRLFHSDRAVGFHDHPMGVPEYWRYAHNYGRSMAIWRAKYPDLVTDLSRDGMEYRYGFISRTSSLPRIVKHYAKAVVANRLTIGVISTASRALSARKPRWSNRLNQLGYYHHFKRSFRKHSRLIQEGKIRIHRRPRVCMLVALLPPEYSGAARQAVTLASELHRSGYAQVSMLAFTLRKELSGRSTFNGIPTHRMYTRSRGWVGKLFLSCRIALHLVRLRRTYDILHIHGGVFLIDFPTLIGRVFGRKTILKMTTWGEDDPAAIKSSRFSWLKYPLFLMADQYVATSPQLHDSYSKCGLDERRLSVIPNAVDGKRFRPADSVERRALRTKLGLPENEPVAVTVGPIIERKRVDLLIQVWAEIADRLPGALLAHVGPHLQEPSLLERIEAVIRSRSLADRIVFLGLRENPEEYLRAADVFLFASEREGSPNAVIEAMATGLPCVLFELPGITDGLITHLENGVIIERGNIGAFVAHLVALLSDRPLRDHLGMAARRTVEATRELSVVAGQYAQLYHALLGQRTVAQTPVHDDELVKENGASYASAAR